MIIRMSEIFSVVKQKFQLLDSTIWDIVVILLEP
jgi:hypothetical protein